MHQLFRFMQNISLEVEDGADAGAYPSIVLGIEEGRHLTVSVPLARGREVDLAAGSRVRVHLTRPDGLYVFPSRVEARPAGRPSLVLAWPDTSEHIQRREYARVGVAIPVRLLVRGAGDAPDRTVRALSTNLSAGGIHLVVPEPVEMDAQLLATLELPGSGEHSCEARVLRAGDAAEPAGEYPHWAALEFVGMLDSVRSELTEFILEVQRDQRRRDLP